MLETRDGSYWNYEIPYALASGLFPPGGPQARGALRYLLDHGSLLLGLVRINAYSLYEHPRYPTSGTDDVYLLNLARFLADEEQPGRLVVSLYGQIAAGMTRGTFVSGEAGSVAPIPGQRFRTMYLPPNSVSNAAFLETLRLLLVHELSGGNGTPDGLELAFSTPRAWLDPGKTIRRRRRSDELRPDLLHTAGAARLGRGVADRSPLAGASPPQAPPPPSRRPPAPRRHAERKPLRALRLPDRDDRPERPERHDLPRGPVLTAAGSGADYGAAVGNLPDARRQDAGENRVEMMRSVPAATGGLAVCEGVFA